MNLKSVIILVAFMFALASWGQDRFQTNRYNSHYAGPSMMALEEEREIPSRSNFKH